MAPAATFITSYCPLQLPWMMLGSAGCGMIGPVSHPGPTRTAPMLKGVFSDGTM